MSEPRSATPVFDPSPANGYITSKSEVCGGKPCVAGTRIRVQDVVLVTKYGTLPAEQVLRAFPTLTLAQVHAALAYYFDHVDRIHKDIDESERLAVTMKTKNGSPVEEKLAKMRGDDATNDPISIL